MLTRSLALLATTSRWTALMLSPSARRLASRLC